MSESGDFDPGEWGSSRRNFNDERRDYEEHARVRREAALSRSYAYPSSTTSPRRRRSSASSAIENLDLVPTSLSTNSESPLVVAIDNSFSMGVWTSIVFGKCAYLDIEGKEYLGQDREISFAAVGDIFSDQYGFQARPFTSGLDLKKRLKELVIEENGGPSYRESYDICSLYYARNTQMPNVTGKPPFIFIGDEGMYDVIDKDKAKKYAKVHLEGRVNTADVMEELKNKFSVYLIRKPYKNPLENRAENDAILHQWQTYIGKDHIANLTDPQRVLDVIFGILAKEKGKIDYFQKEIEERQIDPAKPDEGIEKVEKAYTALRDIFGRRLTVQYKNG